MSLTTPTASAVNTTDCEETPAKLADAVPVSKAEEVAVDGKAIVTTPTATAMSEVVVEAVAGVITTPVAVADKESVPIEAA